VVLGGLAGRVQGLDAIDPEVRLLSALKGLVEGCEEGVELSGDIALQAAHDLPL
jgi:hypothetical protein